MIYILINKKTNRVMYTSEKKFSEYSDNLLLAEVESLPQSYDYLIVENITEKTNTWKEIQEDYDDNGEIVAKEVEMSRTYFTCDVIAKFKPEPTTEQLEAKKQKHYETLCQKYIAQKYSQSDENKIVREYLVDTTNSEKKLQFLEYNAYVEQCKLRAREEIYK